MVSSFDSYFLDSLCVVSDGCSLSTSFIAEATNFDLLSQSLASASLDMGSKTKERILQPSLHDNLPSSILLSCAYFLCNSLCCLYFELLNVVSFFFLLHLSSDSLEEPICLAPSFMHWVLCSATTLEPQTMKLEFPHFGT